MKASEKEKEGGNFKLEHVLGARAIPGGICAANDEIFYQAANRVVIQNVVTRSQRFIEAGEVTAMAVNLSGNIIGVAETGTKTVKFYDPATLLCKHRLV